MNEPQDIVLTTILALSMTPAEWTREAELAHGYCCEACLAGCTEQADWRDERFFERAGWSQTGHWFSYELRDILSNSLCNAITNEIPRWLCNSCKEKLRE